MTPNPHPKPPYQEPGRFLTRGRGRDLNGAGAKGYTDIPAHGIEGELMEAVEAIQVVGHFSGNGAEAMGIDWMTRVELVEAIPPAYTAEIGSYLLTHLKVAA